MPWQDWNRAWARTRAIGGPVALFKEAMAELGLTGTAAVWTEGAEIFSLRNTSQADREAWVSRVGTAQHASIGPETAKDIRTCGGSGPRLGHDPQQDS